jgi:hypothetical protein
MKVDTGFIVGCDLGQTADPTAIVIVQRFEDRHYVDARGEPVSAAYAEEMRNHGARVSFTLKHARPTYDLRDAWRLDLGTPYPQVEAELKSLMGRWELQPGVWDGTDGRVEGGDRQPPVLVVDATGVGKPILDHLKAGGLSPVGILIHGGDTVSYNGSWKVPKRDLVGTVSVLLQNGGLRIAKDLRYAPILTDELLRFRVKIDPVTSHDSYGAWRDGEHDDLVLATAIACWHGDRRPKPLDPGDFPPAYMHA